MKSSGFSNSNLINNHEKSHEIYHSFLIYNYPVILSLFLKEIE